MTCAALAVCVSATAGTASAASEPDVTPPTFDIHANYENGYLRDDDHLGWLNLTDDTTAPVPFEVTITDTTDGAEIFRVTGEDAGYGDVRGPVGLVHARKYVVTMRARDAAGNETSKSTTVTADNRPPEWTITQLPTETDDPTPTVAGTSTNEPGDWSWMNVNVGNGRDSWSADTFVVDGAFTTKFKTPIPPGDYTLSLRTADEAYNTWWSYTPLRILPPVAPSAPLDPLPTLPAPAPADVALDLTAAQLAQSARTTLRQRGLTRTLRSPNLARFGANGAGIAKLVVTARGRTVYSGRQQVVRSGPSVVRFRATARGRKALRAARSAKLTVKATFAPRGRRAVTSTTRATVRR